IHQRGVEVKGAAVSSVFLGEGQLSQAAPLPNAKHPVVLPSTTQPEKLVACWLRAPSRFPGEQRELPLNVWAWLRRYQAAYLDSRMFLPERLRALPASGCDERHRQTIRPRFYD